MVLLGFSDVLHTIVVGITDPIMRRMSMNEVACLVRFFIGSRVFYGIIFV